MEASRKVDELEFLENHRSYRLCGRVLRLGDRIEVPAPGGWLAGTFEWTGNEHAWPRLVIETGEGPDDLLVVVLPPGMRCRWPEG